MCATWDLVICVHDYIRVVLPILEYMRLLLSKEGKTPRRGRLTVALYTASCRRR